MLATQGAGKRSEDDENLDCGDSERRDGDSVCSGCAWCDDSDSESGGDGDSERRDGDSVCSGCAWCDDSDSESGGDGDSECSDDDGDSEVGSEYGDCRSELSDDDFDPTSSGSGSAAVQGARFEQTASCRLRLRRLQRGTRR
jgi:hypothetical protein